jgi:hypothetical protein
MSEITTERFHVNPATYWTQFEEMAEFTNDPAVRTAYTEAGREGVLDNYSDVSTGCASARRLADSISMDGGPIRAGGDVVGTWSTIEGARYMRPESVIRRIGGLHIDYAAIGLTNDQHVEVARQLMVKRREVGDRVLALLADEEVELALGIPLTMQTVGPPSFVRLPLMRRLLDVTYGIPRDTKLQMYESTHQYKRSDAQA